MERLYFLSKSTAAAQRLTTMLRRFAQDEDRLRVLPTRRGLSDELDLPSASYEELTDARNSRRRGVLVGLITGIGVALTLGAINTQLPLSLTTMVIAGGVSGSALGLVIGTIVGPSEKHPILAAHSEQLRQGAVMLTLDAGSDRVDEVVAVAKAADREVNIEIRTLTEVSALA